MLTKLLSAPALLAAVSLTATPAAAAEMPLRQSAPAEAASHYGPYVGIGSGWGWGGGHRDRYRRRGSSAGDILTGVIILGTIAAVANAARRSERRPYPERYPVPDRRGDYRANGPQGLDGAADLCLREVERNARAREVSLVERSANGWLVTGAMADGAAFSCSIGADGRIERLEVGGRAQDLASANNQYDDDRYRAARAGADAGPQPAYPGGPLPGEDAGSDSPGS